MTDLWILIFFYLTFYNLLLVNWNIWKPIYCGRLITASVCLYCVCACMWWPCCDNFCVHMWPVSWLISPRPRGYHQPSSSLDSSHCVNLWPKTTPPPVQHDFSLSCCSEACQCVCVCVCACVRACVHVRAREWEGNGERERERERADISIFILIRLFFIILYVWYLLSCFCGTPSLGLWLCILTTTILFISLINLALDVVGQ